MRWIEIDATSLDLQARDLLDAVRQRQAELPGLQEDMGLDSPLIVRFLEEQGQLLFRAVTACTPDAFAVEADQDAEPFGYHLRIDAADADLPWSCLHNGLRFVLETAPICAAPWSAATDDAPRPRQWMRRLRESRFAASALGESAPAEVARRYRPEGCADPEILFVDGRRSGAGHARAWEEREDLDAMLEAPAAGSRLATLASPSGTPGPAEILRGGHRFQGFHYANLTHRRRDDASVSPGELDLWPDAGDQPGGDLELAGMDPVESLLDEVNARAERDLAPTWSPQSETTAATLARPAWEFEDGPLRPEDLAAHDAAPPLVFSNSYLSLPELGGRFLSAGTSTFVGTQALVSTADARTFAADVYAHLSRGATTADAVREAALAARDRLGADHPLWLSYGVVGAGDLALQYL